jgi:hypothetical protein
MGPAAKERFANVMSMLERGIIAPVEVIAHKSWFRAAALRYSSRRGHA